VKAHSLEMAVWTSRGLELFGTTSGIAWWGYYVVYGSPDAEPLFIWLSLYFVYLY
jgi:hypothetical protein